MVIQVQFVEFGIMVIVVVENFGFILFGYVLGMFDFVFVVCNYGIFGDLFGMILVDFGGDGGGDWGVMNWDNVEILLVFEVLQWLQDVEEKW